MNLLSPASRRSVNPGRETGNRGSFEVLSADTNATVPMLTLEASEPTVPVLWDPQPLPGNASGFAEGIGSSRIEQEVKSLERRIRGRAAEIRRKYGKAIS